MSGFAPPGALLLRQSTHADIDFFFELQQDQHAAWMAAFTSANLSDRVAFEARWSRVLADPTIAVRTVVVRGKSVGQVLRHLAKGHLEVSHWIDRPCWGSGYATSALRLLLEEFPERPVQARVAHDNIGSLRVLQHNGFSITGEEESPAAARGSLLRELVLTLST